MAKVIIFKNQNQTVDIYNNPLDLVLGLTTIEQLMREGGHPLIDKNRAEVEIRRRVDMDGLKEEDVRPYFEKMVTGGATEDEAWDCLARLCKRPHHVSYRIADVSNIPTDRVFRDAWHDEAPTKTVDVCPVRAKEIKADHLRALRQPKLEALDAEYQKADERGDAEKKKEIAAKKQKLRDITKIELPDDLAELENFLPEELR